MRSRIIKIQKEKKKKKSFGYNEKIRKQVPLHLDKLYFYMHVRLK